MRVKMSCISSTPSGVPTEPRRRAWGRANGPGGRLDSETRPSEDWGSMGNSALGMRILPQDERLAAARPSRERVGQPASGHGIGSRDRRHGSAERRDGSILTDSGYEVVYREEQEL